MAAPALAIPGFEFARGPIGSGGFADVYIYRQLMPSREVAVKVLRDVPGPTELAQFQAEANVMAQLSGHSSIVSVFVADTADDGRAYLVMELCPGPHLGDRYRTERLDVAEVLETSIRIASAVETAHRVGVLHRDIKPANILTSAFGAPLLTDFGIAAAAGDSPGGYGMSIPWAAPESFADDPPLDVRTDVYSLAATTYSLLAGRSPFEVTGAANGNATLMHRIERQAVARVLRADVPETLNDLLLRALSKRMEDRPRTALAFAQGLQDIQAQLGLRQTQIDVIDASPDAVTAPPAADDEGTRVRPVQIVVPDEIAAMGTRLRPQLIAPDVAAATRAKPRVTAPTHDTMHRSAPRSVGPDTTRPALTGSPAHADDPVARPRVGQIAPVGVGLLVVGAVVTAVVIGGSGQNPQATGPSRPSTPADAIDVVGGTPAAVAVIDVEPRPGAVMFTWAQSDAERGDTFLLRAGPQGSLRRVESVGASYAAPAHSGDRICLEVKVVRDGSASAPETNCGEAR